MALTAKEIERLSKKPFKDPFFLRPLLFFVRQIARIPFVDNYLKTTSGGLSGSIFRCWGKKDYDKAVDIAIFALEKYRHNKGSMNHFEWWSFMKYAVESLEKSKNKELRNKVMEKGKNGILPYEGYDVSYSFVAFSRWEYENKNYQTATELATIASEADPTWAEPDFILGWYSLVLGKNQAEKHFEKAIQKDKRILFRISNDSICKKNQHIIKKLKQKYILEDKKTGPNNLMEGNAE